MKTIRSGVENMKPKYTQPEFSYIEHMDMGGKIEPKYTPPKPSEMTDVELEKWYISSPNKRLKSEILKRIDRGVKFSRLRVVQYLGMKPQLVPVFKD